ncbi:MAG: gliding motility-associated C-terminal domain-containing protein [Bacteroidota bacterium]|nr:gliding motility-associated C-terminal domain-containing protein [Bacteroidota bacterium]
MLFRIPFIRFPFFVASLFMLLQLNLVKADHVVGSDVSYACTTTPGVYQVMFKIYRDCQGIPMCPNCPTSLSPSCQLSVSLRGANVPAGSGLPASPCAGVSFGSSSLAVVTAVSGFDVVQLCSQEKTICNNCGTRTPGTFTPGIEVYTFEGTVSLASVPASCCLVSVGFSTCCRNTAITTLANPSSLGFYTEAVINRCATPCNSSPTFTNDPVAVTCAGQDFTYNLGAIDPDGDSLSYAFGQSLVSAGAQAPYVSPYSPNVPLPYLGAPIQSPPAVPPIGINIDGVTGDIRFRPMGNFVANLIIEVRQWKMIGGVPTLMGITRRDIQFYSKVCPANNPPVLRTFTMDGTLTVPQPNFSHSICAGQQVCFIVSGWDNTAGWDTTDMTWNAPTLMVSKGATFVKAYNPANRTSQGPKYDSMRFCWTPGPEMASNLPYYFVVTVKDRACPIPARTTRSFSILVRRVPTATIQKVNKNCGFYDFGYTQTNTVPLNHSYTKFLVESGPNTNSYVQYNGPNVSNHKFTQGGWHRIRLQLTTTAPPAPNGCPNDNIWDSVLVPTSVDVSVRDTFNCFGTPVVTKASGKFGTPYGNSYRYTLYSGGMGSNTVLRPFGIDSNFSINPGIPGVTSSYKVLIQDLNGCRDSALLNVFTRNLPLKELPSSARYCFGTTDTVDAGNSNGSVSVWRWRKIPVSPVLSDSVSQKITPRDSGQYIVRKTDINGCSQLDTIMVYINEQVPVSAGPNRTICEKDPPINIVATGTTAAIDSFQWRAIPISDPNVVLSRSATLNVSPPTNTSYQVTGFLTYGGVGCSHVDTMDVVVKPLPIINRPDHMSLCRNTNVVLLPSITSTNKPGLITSVWTYPPNPSAITGNQVIISNLANLPPAPPTPARGNIIRLTVNDADGCRITDSIVISIFPVPLINAGPSRTFCDFASVFNINPGSQLYSPNGGALATNEEWTGRGIYKPNAGINYYAFNPQAADVVSLPDTNIITYRFTATFPLNNSVSFTPAVGGFFAPSPIGGCVATDTAVFGVIRTPKLETGIAPSLCRSGSAVELDNHMLGRSTTSANPQSSYWYIGAPDQIYRPAITNGGRTFNPNSPILENYTRQYTLVYADTSTTCRVADTTTIQVNENPVVDIDYATSSDSAICKTRGSVLFFMNPNNIPTTEGEMSSFPVLPAANFDVTAGRFTIDNVPAGLYNVKYYYKDPGTGCDNRDSINIRVQDPPQINITDDGTVCSYGAVFNVGFITVPSAPYTWSWSTPDGNGSIADNGAAGIAYTATAADIARGRITFRATTVDLTTDPDVCAAVSDSATYIIKPKPEANFSIAPDRGCVDARYGLTLNATYTAVPSSVAGSTYKWFVDVTDFNNTPANPAPFDQTVFSGLYTQPGNHRVYLFVEADGCTDTADAPVTAWPSPVAAFTTNPESTTIAKPNFDFFNQTTIADNAALQYIWYFPPLIPNIPRVDYTFEPKQVQFAADTGWQWVKLTAISPNGCYDSTLRRVRIDPDITVFIPNVFRPISSDGRGGSTVDCGFNCNKTFKVSATGFETIEIFLFNRWGQKVYETYMTDKTYDPNEGWNGKDFNKGQDCQQDAYIYQVNATSFNGKKYTYSGSITLVR